MALFQLVRFPLRRQNPIRSRRYPRSVGRVSTAPTRTVGLGEARVQDRGGSCRMVFHRKVWRTLQPGGLRSRRP
jgi:hypothetical protein